MPCFCGNPEARYRAHLAEARGDGAAAEAGFKTAAATFREYGLPFERAITQLEHGEWLVAEGRRDEAEPLIEESREILERLGATPWLERLDRLAAPVSAGAP